MKQTETRPAAIPAACVHAADLKILEQVLLTYPALVRGANQRQTRLAVMECLQATEAAAGLLG